MKKLAVIALHLIACEPSQQAREAAAQGAYLAEHVRCVERYDTKEAIDACRDQVRVQWGIVTRVRDAGADR